MLRFITAILAILLAGHADARVSRGSYKAPSAQGNHVFNVGFNDQTNMNLNVFKVFQSQSFSINSLPTYFDQDGFPIAMLGSGGSFGSALLQAGTGFTDNGTTYAISWESSRPWTGQLSANINVTLCQGFPVGGSCSTGAHSTSVFKGGGSAGACTGTDPYLTGTDWCRVEFNFVGYAGNQFSFGYPSGANNYAAGTGPVYMVRKGQDEACVKGQTSGPSGTCVSSIYTPEYIALMAGQHPNPIRTLGLTNVNNGNISSWNCRTKPTTFSNLNSVYCPSMWAGGGGGSASGANITCPNVSGPFCSSDVFTASANSAYPTLVDGTIVQGWINFASVGTTATLNYAGSGAKTIVDLSTFGVEVFAGPATFIYNSFLGKWIYSAGGVIDSTPVEDRAVLANNLNADLWDNISCYTDANYQTNTANAAFATLKSTLNYLVEQPNEGWNFGYACTHYFYTMGAAMGWTPSSNANIHSFYALRLEQMAAAMRASNFGNSSRLQIVNAWVSAAFAAAEVEPYQLEGQLLDVNAWPVLCTYLGFTFSGTCSSNPQYNVSPHRPGDVSSVFSFANYWGGQAFNTGCYAATVDGCAQNMSPTAQAQLQSMFNNYNAGGAGIATAKAQLDLDARAGWGFSVPISSVSGGTITIGGVTSFTGTINSADTTLTTTSVTGTIAAGQTLTQGSFIGLGVWFIGTQISGTAGGAGVYNISGNITAGAIGPTAMATNILPNGMTVVALGSPPTQLTANTVAYYIVNSGTGGTANIQLSTTPGGSPIATLTGGGSWSIGLVGDSTCSSRFGTVSLLDIAADNLPCFQRMMTNNGWAQPIYAYEGGLSDLTITSTEANALGMTNLATSAAVTFNTTSGPTVNWANANTLFSNGDGFSFSGGSVNPGGISPSSPGHSAPDYYIANVSASGFDIANTPYDQQLLVPNSTGTGPFNGLVLKGGKLLFDYDNDATFGYNIAFDGSSQFVGKNPTSLTFNAVPNNKKASLLTTSGYSQWSDCGSIVPTPHCFALYNGYAAQSIQP